MNIRGLPSNFAGCKYFIKSNLPDVLALYETNFDNSIDSFSVMSNLILVRNDAVTVLHYLAVYVKDRLPFAQNVSVENFANCYLYFRLALLQSVS